MMSYLFNDVLSRASLRVLRPTAAAQLEEPIAEEHDMNTDEPLVPEEPLVFEGLTQQLLAEI